MVTTRSGCLARLLAAGALALCALAASAGDVPARAKLATYLGGGCTGRDKLPAFEHWLGRPVDMMVDFLSVDSWKGLESTSIWGGDCWRDWGGRVVLSIPMLPRDGTSTLADGAAGAYDDHIRRIATNLAERGHGRAIIRIGWEFNAPWFSWTSVREPAQYVAYWRRFVAVMRSVPNTQFRFDWCPILGIGVASPEPAYPGDDVVDIIGADVYNVNYFPPGIGPAQRWQALRDAPFGLDWHQRFARAHGKPISFPEWGTGTRPDGHGGGDDAVFMTGMVDWIRAHDVAYQGYWDYGAPDFNAKLSDGSQPAAAAVYLDAFGAAR
jgi:hypothetical protein